MPTIKRLHFPVLDMRRKPSAQWVMHNKERRVSGRGGR
jgi:hypothetical protein